MKSIVRAKKEEEGEGEKLFKCGGLPLFCGRIEMAVFCLVHSFLSHCFLEGGGGGDGNSSNCTTHTVTVGMYHSVIIFALGWRSDNERER